MRLVKKIDIKETFSRIGYLYDMSLDFPMLNSTGLVDRTEIDLPWDARRRCNSHVMTSTYHLGMSIAWTCGRDPLKTPSFICLDLLHGTNLTEKVAWTQLWRLIHIIDQRTQTVIDSSATFVTEDAKKMTLPRTSCTEARLRNHKNRPQEEEIIAETWARDIGKEFLRHFINQDSIDEPVQSEMFTEDHLEHLALS